tara:strand:+ start:688 stop:1782 length:1095 start_codon:yes stop_codon:yes gene_type:complete
MSYANIYRIDPNKVNYAQHYSNDYIIFGQFSSSGSGPIPPLYIPPQLPQLPQFTLSPGIIYSEQIINTETIPTEQILGVGQGMALRLLTDISSHPYGDINVTELRNRVIFSIDENDDLNISCIPGSTFPKSDMSNISLEGTKIVTMIFNVLDASGWLKQGEKVDLSFVRDVSGEGFTINDNTIFEISGNTSVSVAENLDDLSNNIDIIDLSNDDYFIEISNNDLKLTLLDPSYNNWYLKNFSFNISDSLNTNYLLTNTDLNFNIRSATVYNLTDDSSFKFIVDYSNNSNINSVSSHYIDLSYDNSINIGKISVYNYFLQNISSDNYYLGPVGGYFNINQVEYTNSNNLITISNSISKIGQIYRV